MRDNIKLGGLSVTLRLLTSCTSRVWPLVMKNFPWTLGNRNEWWWSPFRTAVRVRVVRVRWSTQESARKTTHGTGRLLGNKTVENNFEFHPQWETPVPESIELGSDNPGGGKSLSETSVVRGASVPVFQESKGCIGENLYHFDWMLQSWSRAGQEYKILVELKRNLNSGDTY